MTRKKIKILFLVSVLINISTVPMPPTYISFRPQSVNNPRHMVGTQRYINKVDMDHPYGLLSATFEYNKTFNTHSLTKQLFDGALQKTGCDDHALIISGSAVANRGSKDWLADYFYLPPDFKSSVTFKPSINNFIVDFNWYLGLDQWHEGLYFALYAPLVHTRNSMHIHEKISSKSSTNYPAGYFGPQPVTPGSLAPSFSYYANGGMINDIEQSLAGTNVAIALQSLNNAKISSCTQKKTRLADLRAILGWNMLNEEDDDHEWRVGIYGSVSAPTGIRPKGRYLFEPMVGNGHHLELGFGVNGEYTLWNNPNHDYRLILYGDITVSHLFGARQRRTFDLKDKPFSRYMLAIKFKDVIADNLKGGAVTPSAQFDNEMAPVANLSTLQVKASAAVQVDLAAMVTFSMPHWTFDLGYDLWARSAEDMHLDDNACATVNIQEWGLKGDAQMFGFVPAGGVTLPINTPVALSATQSGATINSGLNLGNTVNANIDSPALATADTNNIALQNQITGIPSQINTSVNPQFFGLSDFETCGITTMGLSSSLFGNIQYHWNNHAEWEPSLGLGFKVEFAHNSRPCEQKKHPRCAASLWSIWIKSAVAFD